jgi:hypothetical protein
MTRSKQTQEPEKLKYPVEDKKINVFVIDKGQTTSISIREINFEFAKESLKIITDKHDTVVVNIELAIENVLPNRVLTKNKD